MATDCRISTSLPSHPKTKKLIRRLGPEGGWALICLFLWAAGNRSNGDLSGLSAEDVELAADWAGDEGAFVRELVAVGFLDGDEGGYLIHDWEEHNPWAAGSDARSLKAKWNAAKRHHGEAEADRLVPEYAAIRNASSTADSRQTADAQQTTSNAPSPSPSPSPSVEAPKPEARASRLPDNWVLDPDWQDWAEAERPDLDIGVVACQFRDFWVAKPGKDGRKLDWLATWRNWVRNQRATQPVKTAQAFAPPVTVASNAAERTAAEMAARLAPLTPEQKAAADAARREAMARVRQVAQQ